VAAAAGAMAGATSAAPVVLGVIPGDTFYMGMGLLREMRADLLFGREQPLMSFCIGERHYFVPVRVRGSDSAALFALQPSYSELDGPQLGEPQPGDDSEPESTSGHAR
jgi:hypothetical protein